MDELVARADEIAVLGAGLAARGGLVGPELAVPLYIRDKVALTTAERLARGGKA
jgi:tRNA threonylcarbamoyladenosine biosynthesis protein TsaB